MCWQLAWQSPPCFEVLSTSAPSLDRRRLISKTNLWNWHTTGSAWSGPSIRTCLSKAEEAFVFNKGCLKARVSHAFSLSPHGIFVFMAFKNETIFILKANISPALKMLAFENQYILANNVGNRHVEHLIMIEHIKHFSSVVM